ncbi:MFS transporter [Bradyrhizobium jicamae]|uniref:MFS transporter n=1 Tax=Bradyrhizobium jicamae TaxID=280332 RepID=A0ABS5FRY9_9BRAD|nr:MFS transporter [Bradyrhizobium jicamae]MBR0799495.1 MFS transporter [Bradyrhizobium jicamae]
MNAQGLHARALVLARIMTTTTFFAHGFGVGMWSIAIANVKAGLKISDSEIGLALLAMSIGAILAMPIAAVAVSRYGGGRVSALCGLAYGFLLMALALAANTGSLALILFCLGLAHGSLEIVMNAQASAVEIQWRSAIMSSFHAAWSMGGLLGAAAGGLIGAYHLPPEYGLCIPALVVIALMGATLGPAFNTRVDKTEAHFELVLPSQKTLGLALISFLALVTEGSVANWTSIYLRDSIGPAADTFAAGYGSFAISMAIFRLAGGGLVRRFGPSTIMSCGAVVAAGGFAVVLAWPSLIAAYLGYALLGAGIANVVPLAFSIAGQRFSDPARSILMVATAGYAGYVIGPPLIGTVADHLSLRYALGIPLAALVLVAVVSASGRAAGRRARPIEASADV